MVIKLARRRTVWDINKNSEELFHKIACELQCSQCKRIFKGSLILDKVELKVVDTDNFMILNGIVCDICDEPDRTSFADMMDDIAAELGTTISRLGIMDNMRDNIVPEEETTKE